MARPARMIARVARARSTRVGRCARLEVLRATQQKSIGVATVCFSSGAVSSNSDYYTRRRTVKRMMLCIDEGSWPVRSSYSHQLQHFKSLTTLTNWLESSYFITIDDTSTDLVAARDKLPERNLQWYVCG